MRELQQLNDPKLQLDLNEANRLIAKQDTKSAMLILNKIKHSLEQKQLLTVYDFEKKPKKIDDCDWQLQSLYRSITEALETQKMLEKKSGKEDISKGLEQRYHYPLRSIALSLQETPNQLSSTDIDDILMALGKILVEVELEHSRHLTALNMLETPKLVPQEKKAINKPKHNTKHRKNKDTDKKDTTKQVSQQSSWIRHAAQTICPCPNFFWSRFKPEPKKTSANRVKQP